MRQWWDAIVSGQPDVRLLHLDAGPGVMLYEFSDCFPTRLSLQVTPAGTSDVLSIFCQVQRVTSLLRQGFFQWLNDVLDGVAEGRDFAIDASDALGIPVLSVDYFDTVITGYRFPIFDKSDVKGAAADAMRFQPSRADTY
jgi:hypothetical protein